MSKLEAIKQLNEKINELHRAHYSNSETGLIDKTDAPNSNTIYHLYSDGEVTYQKGSWAYLQRSEFSMSSPVYIDYMESPYKFPKEMSNGITYAILTSAECREMRKQMDEIKKMVE